jgi:hypothetical protein
MDNELQLISDGDGLAVIGDPAAVERFLISEGLQSQSKDLNLPQLSTMLFKGSGLAHAGAAMAAGSGRWVQLTQNSTQLLHRAGNGLMTNSQTGLSMGVVQGSGGHIQGIVQFAQGPGSILANPAVLAGAAGIMAQMAMQQAMNEIKDYLVVIDAKIDDVLRAQKDAVVADMIGVDLAIEEAMTIRDEVGRVSEITWSKVQGGSMTIGRTQAYVLRQLDALAEKLERERDVAYLAEISKDAERSVREWLAVLARCFQLQDALAILELDRVLDSAPDDLNQHRLGLKSARKRRLDTIAVCTERLLVRMDAAASRADSKVLLHPIASKGVVESSNHVATGVIEFHGRLGIERDRDSIESTRWVDAATDARDKAIETGALGVETARRVGAEQFVRARSMTDRFSGELAKRAARLRKGDPDQQLQIEDED